MVAVLEKAIRAVASKAVVCIVSDHGMARVDHELNLNVAFVKAGLITPAERKTARAPAITSWKAQPWSASGSAAIVLKDANDQETLTKVKDLLTELAADPANGIAAILDRKAIEQMGGSPRAAFWVDMKPGFSIGSAMTGPLTREVPVRGTHGYAPAHPEMRASFFMAGPGIRKGAGLGEIEVRSCSHARQASRIEFPDSGSGAAAGLREISGLECEPQSHTELPFIDSIAGQICHCGDLGKSAQIRDPAVAENHVRDVIAREVEVRRVCKIECLGPKL